MTVVVTGASGHVGGNLVRALLKDGRRVRCLVYRDTRALDGLDVELVQANVLNAGSLETAFAGAETVFNLAAQLSVGGAKASDVERINVQGTRNVIDACRAAGANKLIHFSSVHALKQAPHDKPLDETRDLIDDPNWPIYDRTKAEGERLVLQATERGLHAVVLNPAAVIGPYDFKPSPMGDVLLMMAKGRMPALVEGGYTWVDVRDVVKAAIAAETKARPGESYLLGGHWRSFSELAECWGELTGRPMPRMVCPMWLARVGAPFSSAWARVTGARPLYTSESLQVVRDGNRVLNCEKARIELGFRPHDFEDTLAATYEWFVQNEFLPQPAAKERTA